ncbi:MAG: PAS domain-containing protein [Rhodocyclaceae bacterium]|nr:PAS domain-containing protein [Rhodocyclaceae bacterium]
MTRSSERSWLSEHPSQDSDRRLQDFAEAASDWFWEMDADLRFTFFSDRIRQVMGVDPATLIGKTRRELMNPADIDAKWAEHLAEMEQHRPIRDFEYRFVLAEGGARHIRVSGKPIFDDEGRFRGYRGVGHDITGEMEARQRPRHHRRDGGAPAAGNPADPAARGGGQHLRRLAALRCR